AQLDQRRAGELAALCREIGFDPNEAALPADQGITRQEIKQAENVLITLSPGHFATPEPNLPSEAVSALHEHFGYNSFRPGQATVVDRVLKGESVLAVLPTGAGKSLTYQLPALLMPGATLVLSPLIALMKDQIDNLPPALAARATTIHSALDAEQVATRLRGVAE